MKLLILLALFTFFNKINAIQINCDFSRSDPWTEVGVIYYCAMTNNVFEMTPENSEVTQINGMHYNFKTNKEVLGFWAEAVNMLYFPKNLNVHFENLIAVGFENTGMSEVHKEDLQPFGEKLTFFRLSGTNLQIIEKDLFIYNPNLRTVVLQRNKIRQIDPFVFDNLHHLKYLSLKSNYCIDPSHNTWERVAEDIALMKTICSTEHYQCEDLLKENNYLRSKILMLEKQLEEINETEID
ncbi:hypothetical protein PVAND_001043 [Polypedilum vanderplanki]|uniref:Uncharacterized protein n=1 Tax=Polypedilum vanderplanki TaxID=319348 RepID=A0A9J6BM38_POLVA|nr:hypothetical protein PVAND_001043 [Polypedilum vanderplanki]